MSPRTKQKIKAAESYALVALVLGTSVALAKITAQDEQPAPPVITVSSLTLGATSSDGYNDFVKQSTKLDFVGAGELFNPVPPVRLQDGFCGHIQDRLGIKKMGMAEDPSDPNAGNLSSGEIGAVIGDGTGQPDYSVLVPEGQVVNPLVLTDYAQRVSSTVGQATSDCKDQVVQGLDAAAKNDQATREKLTKQSIDAGAKISAGMQSTLIATRKSLQAIGNSTLFSGTTSTPGNLPPGGGQAAALEKIRMKLSGSELTPAEIIKQMKKSKDQGMKLLNAFGEGLRNNSLVHWAELTDEPLQYDDAIDLISASAGAGFGGDLVHDIVSGVAHEKVNAHMDAVTEAKGKMEEEGASPFDLSRFEELLRAHKYPDPTNEKEETAGDLQNNLMCQLFADQELHAELKDLITGYIANTYHITIVYNPPPFQLLTPPSYYLNQNKNGVIKFDPAIVDLADKITTEKVPFACLSFGPEPFQYEQPPLKVIKDAMVTGGYLPQVSELNG